MSIPSTLSRHNVCRLFGESVNDMFHMFFGMYTGVPQCWQFEVIPFGVLVMPLIHSKSKKAFRENIKTEVTKGNKPIKQAVAIAYSEKRKSSDWKPAADGGFRREVK